MLEKNPDTVKLVYKHFPLGSHRYSLAAAKGAMAAAEQGRFWEFHDKLFAEKKLDDQKIKAIAAELGLDMDRYQKDADSAEIEKLIRRDFEEGRDVGVRGTPTIFVNGHRVKKRSPEGIQAMIEKQINQSRQK